MIRTTAYVVRVIAKTMRIPCEVCLNPMQSSALSLPPVSGLSELRAYANDMYEAVTLEWGGAGGHYMSQVTMKKKKKKKKDSTNW